MIDMDENNLIIFSARPLSLEEYKIFQELSWKRYRDAVGARRILHSKTGAIGTGFVILICLTVGMSEFFLVRPLELIGFDGSVAVSGAWVIATTLFLFVSGASSQWENLRILASQAAETEWAAQMRMAWTGARIDHRGITVEGSHATVFQAWPVLTGVHSEGGLLLFESNGAILIALPEAAIPAGERDRIVDYCAARIDRTRQARSSA